MRSLLEHVGRTLQTRALLVRGQSILVAVSGGLDSLVLLHVLHRLAARNEWRLVVGHFNHQLRGAESEGDERWVQAEAARLGWPCVTERWSVEGPRQARGLGLEGAAREARHEFLGRVAVQGHIPTVALAHHADDQVEHFFLRLFRGAGGVGLGGMKWLGPALFHEGVQLIRPLLDQPKAALETFAQSLNLVPREDASNRCLDHLRNRIRHEVLPWLRAHHAPALSRTVGRAMEILRAEADWVEATAQAWLARGRFVGFDRLALAIQRQCLCGQLLQLSVAPEFELVERLRLHPDRAVTLAGGRRVVRDSSGRVSWQRAERPVAFSGAELVVDLRPKSGVQVFAGVKITWEKMAAMTPRKLPRARAGSEYFADAGLTPGVRLRHWRPGDRFQPIGLGREAKLQDLFTNLKIPAGRRRGLLVAETLEGRIFWVEGVRMAEHFKLDNRTTRVVKWTWKRLVPRAGQ